MTAFDQLHPSIQKWIWDQEWKALRPIQERAIEAVLGGRHDVLLAAATAGGKTEAAFLPIASELAEIGGVGITVLCVSPLKALINDQFDRLTEIFEYIDVPVHRWHGDVSSSAKKKIRDKPSGVLLITPESLEALFVTQGYRVARILGGVQWVVIDEAHVFIDSDRGRQLQSLLGRLELQASRRIPRVGLSATLGDLGLAAEYLRPGEADGVEIAEDESDGQEIRLQIRGYEAKEIPGDEETENVNHQPSAAIDIADHLWSVLRGTNNLVFANSRKMVERLSEVLRRRSEQRRVPNEFFPHHGSLAKELREEAERQLKDPTRPATAVCTSTLELGIDIGQVESVAQVSAPFSVASLRQRLGRSGRRGSASVLRMYIEEAAITDKSPILDQLRAETVQAVAMIELLIERWCEPPDPAGLNLSTLIQQTLSMIAERGGVRAKVAWEALCRDGAFRAVDVARYASLLKCMAAKDLIFESADRTLLLAETGERIVNHFGFFAVFQTPEEFRLLHAGRTLGTLALDMSLTKDVLIVFAGRCWRVVEVDAASSTVVVDPAPGGRMPHFEGGKGGRVHDRIRERMVDVWSRADSASYLDRSAQRFLVEGRSAFVRRELATSPIQREGSGSMLFVCRGDRVLNTIAVLLASRGVKALSTPPVIEVDDLDPEALRRELDCVVRNAPSEMELARSVENKAEGKYDWVLDEELLAADYASRALDLPGALQALEGILGSVASTGWERACGDEAE